VRAAELAGDPAGNPASGAAAGPTSGDANRDLLSALTGRQAGRERAVAESTRRVVMASLGVIKDQQAGRRRTRSLALAAVLIALLAFGPFAWRVADDLIGGEHISDIATQTSLWACILCPAILAAFLIAGWSRRKE
jgi:hypothetical protein